MRMSDWSSDVCSSDLQVRGLAGDGAGAIFVHGRLELRLRLRIEFRVPQAEAIGIGIVRLIACGGPLDRGDGDLAFLARAIGGGARRGRPGRCAGRRRSEEHTSELQSLMRLSYAVFCLKKQHN